MFTGPAGWPVPIPVVLPASAPRVVDDELDLEARLAFELGGHRDLCSTYARVAYYAVTPRALEMAVAQTCPSY